MLPAKITRRTDRANVHGISTVNRLGTTDLPELIENDWLQILWLRKLRFHQRVLENFPSVTRKQVKGLPRY